MARRKKSESTTNRFDELSPAVAGWVGFVVFLLLSLLVVGLPTWGFVSGLMVLLGLLTWLGLSGQPVVKLSEHRELKPADSTQIAEQRKPARQRPDEPLEMIELPGGEFWMGSPESEPGRYDLETRHRVRLSAFAMAKYPITQKLYRHVMGQEGGDIKAELLPAETVRWFDAIQFCNKLSTQMRLKPCYRIVEKKVVKGTDVALPAVPAVEWDHSADGYRLPTEAEWEYACRAGTETAYSFGENPNRLNEYAWFRDNSGDRTHNVGTKKPNGWGFHDLHGNVWEWVWDWYNQYQVLNISGSDVVQVNPIGLPSGSGRVLRGGCYFFGPGGLRSANRYGTQPENGSGGFGFRCVRASRHQR